MFSIPLTLPRLLHFNFLLRIKTLFFSLPIHPFSLYLSPTHAWLNLKRNNEREYDILNENGDHRDPWSVRKLKKVKEASEIVAGAKWKTFIRKIGAYIKKRKQRNNQAQYDAESYALNFDREDGCVIPGFSSKFAAASVDQETRRNEL
ncbi:hypothetical protein NC652_017153 [Populus alba x Populus x berolinensis]|uniref:Uncharacterized protein n=1 Tax=Populus alba x Populus x berolinensis TaxID=444605 RepID=A0AAD6W0J9_9ROSI|nr:hypothetical protein NC652_017153 [Populus alba x Populus x berolinensis]KAJ6994174.1 hypothetical protein NC653_017101 [Populus alba x Populus x berolinensis]